MSADFLLCRPRVSAAVSGGRNARPTRGGAAGDTPDQPPPPPPSEQPARCRASLARDGGSKKGTAQPAGPGAGRERAGKSAGRPGPAGWNTPKPH